MTNTTTHRVGDWLPVDQKAMNAWLRAQLATARRQKKPFLPVVQELQDFIEGDPAAFMLFDQMFKQVHKHTNPAGKPQVRNYRQFLVLLNHIVTHPPEFNKSGVVGFPINAILDWSMGTTSGYAAFLMEEVNAHLKTVLDEWGVYLTTGDSAWVLTDKIRGKGKKGTRPGWLSPAAFEMMAPEGTKDPRQWFIDTFVCDPDAPHFGFTSWDDFFTRALREGARPVASPGDSGVIANACESAPFNYAFDVDRRARFWIKGQPYSLEHMMDHDPLVDQFVSGTVYQAFLSAGSYHRWHSPVSGTIAKAYVVPGSYYSESLANRHDPAGPNNSQGYITAVAARALIFIEADDPRIGLMCVMPVGMAEVSTCQITVYEGQHVEKGDQIGTFHYGGSTHCLFFRPETKVKLDLHGYTPYQRSRARPKKTPPNIPINARIATVVG